MLCTYFCMDVCNPSLQTDKWTFWEPSVITNQPDMHNKLCIISDRSYEALSTFYQKPFHPQWNNQSLSAWAPDREAKKMAVRRHCNCSHMTSRRS